MKCPQCSGRGEIAYACDQGHYGGMEKCAACDGTGQMTKPTPRTDAKAYTPFEDDANPQIVNADFARSLERQCARQSALLREVMENDWCRREFRERIERELKG